MMWNLPHAVTSYFNVREGVGVFLASQVPPGKCLGASRSVTISLVKGLAFWCGLDIDPQQTAELASSIEVDKMGIPLNKKDYYAVALGGLNVVRSSNGAAEVEPLGVSADTHQALETGLMLFHTQAAPDSLPILEWQNREAGGNGHRQHRLERIQELGLDIVTALERGQLHTFGDLLHQSWLERRELMGIADSTLDLCYQAARAQGALGGDVIPAGCGSFLMLYCPPERQDAVRKTLASRGLRPWILALEQEGVQVMQAVSWPQSQIPFPAFSKQPEMSN
jgi:D-glycero-alpha-D-manno-heptose-7-phosphate kinase